ncbi:hypothetical protein K5X82_13355 [Halosquirtibacter xylanolyticus]|uniref:hypothetical protein n=1 Tax=Halosquirtibacter xylanolyticus TaxID=3374599 RepID=UPI0037491E65|nr:hypothetical protein K5X82_13355 [Prolixibacteraceae bacterium]
MYQRLIIYCGILAIGLASCVSKKKYVELETRKKKSDQRVVTLKKELSSTQKELKDRNVAFDQIREDLEYSNTKMLSKVDEVADKMAMESQKNQEISGELEDQLFSYKNENRQLSSTISQMNEDIAKYKSDIKIFKKSLEAKNSELIEVKYALNNEKDKAVVLNNKISSNDDKMMALEQKRAALTKSISSLKSQIKSQNEEIERLKNNVKLLKKQI